MTSKADIAGVGTVPFSRPGRSEPHDLMGAAAARAAPKDAGIDYGRVEQA